MQAGNIPNLSFFYLKSSDSKESLPFFCNLRLLFRKAHILFHYTQHIRHSQQFEYGKIFRVNFMISYEPFYKTLFRKGITEYNLIYKQGFSANTLYRIKQGKPISTRTLDALCDVLECQVEDVIRFVKE